MNENSTMLYKYPGDDIRLRVRLKADDEELAWKEFDNKIVPSEDVKKWLKEGWQKTPAHAMNPPEPEPEPEPEPVIVPPVVKELEMPVLVEEPFQPPVPEPEPEPEPEPKPEVKSRPIFKDPPYLGKKKKEEKPPEVKKEEKPEVDAEALLDEVKKIRGSGSQKKLVAHARKQGILLTGYYSFKKMKKDYLNKLREKYDMD